MKKHTKLFSLIGTAFLAIAVVFAATSCKQNDDDKGGGSGSKPIATIPSSDGKATLTVLSYDKTSGKGTCKVDVPSMKYWITGDFKTDGKQVTLEKTKDSADMSNTHNGNYTISSDKKVTIAGYTFDLTDFFKKLQ